jgi:hypothetical protein
MDGLGAALGQTRKELQAEMTEELNILRSRLDLPLVVNGMAERPRYRVPAGRGRSW